MSQGLLFSLVMRIHVTYRFEKNPERWITFLGKNKNIKTAFTRPVGFFTFEPYHILLYHFLWPTIKSSQRDTNCSYVIFLICDYNLHIFTRCEPIKFCTSNFWTSLIFWFCQVGNITQQLALIVGVGQVTLLKLVIWAQDFFSSVTT